MQNSKMPNPNKLLGHLVENSLLLDSGVLQGLVFEPLLFVIYIKDLLSKINNIA